MRWYDVEPDVYMAISMIECSEMPKQVEYAKYIVKLLKEKDTNMDYIRNTTLNNMDSRHNQRWYDQNETVSTAFEYLKNASHDLQKEVALDVLAYMNINTLRKY